MRRVDLVLGWVCVVASPWWLGCGEEFSPGSSTTASGGASAGGAGAGAGGGLGASAGAGGEGAQGLGGQGGEGGLAPTCGVLCTKWDAQGCAPDGCVEACEELFLFSECEEAAQSAVTCLVGEPNLCQGRHCQAEVQAHGECVEAYCTDNPDQPGCMDG